MQGNKAIIYTHVAILEEKWVFSSIFEKMFEKNIFQHLFLVD